VLCILAVSQPFLERKVDQRILCAYLSCKPTFLRKERLIKEFCARILAVSCVSSRNPGNLEFRK